jgi:hypothetical protein
MRTRIVPGATADNAHILGIQEPLPPGERVLWQGRPDWRVLARRALHLRKLALYFGVLLVLRYLTLLEAGRDAAQAAGDTLPLVLVALFALSLLAGYAWAAARTSVYAITSGRVVLRIGVALPMVINLPLTQIESAALRRHPDGSGDLPLQLKGNAHLAWLHLWPHARPWQLKHPQPMLRAVPQAAAVATILAQALAASGEGTAVAPAAEPEAPLQHQGAAFEQGPALKQTALAA